MTSPKSLEELQEEEHKNDPLFLGFFLYSKPNQRQRWGEPQAHLAHADYDNLFFDLFYVAFAYQLSMILRGSPTGRGLLYFFACFYCVQALWWDKTIYDSRFFVLPNLYHYLYSILVLLVLASAVVHIRPLDILENTNEDSTMFSLCLSLLLSQLLSMGREMELLLVGGAGDKELISSTASFGARSKIFPVLLISAATIYTGVQYFGNDGHRDLASTTTEGSADDTAIYLLLAAGLSSTALFIANILYRRWRNIGRSIPINVTFAIHRCGEWILLMMGETVLSLLIAPYHFSAGYYVTFVAGIFTIMMLEYTHFRSEPDDPDHHAWRRSVYASFRFFSLFQIYSAALISLGASYDLLLEEHSADENNKRWLFGEGEDGILDSFFNRWLASPGVDLQYYKQNIAHLFSGSLTVIFLCLDLIMMNHYGWKQRWHQCSRYRRRAIYLVILRCILLIATAIMGFFVTTPWILSMLGFAVVLLQIAARLLFSTIKQQYEEASQREQNVKSANHVEPIVEEVESQEKEVQER